MELYCHIVNIYLMSVELNKVYIVIYRKSTYVVLKKKQLNIVTTFFLYLNVVHSWTANIFNTKYFYVIVLVVPAGGSSIPLTVVGCSVEGNNANSEWVCCL